MDVTYQDYLSSSVIKKISNIALRAKLVVEGFIIGLHKSPYHGFSVEFSEHRPYSFGDEIKYIDWKLLAKTDKLYIKQFEEETNLNCHILFDTSASMQYGSGEIQKFDYAQTLCASLSYMMIKQQDAVGLTTFDTKINISIPPKSRPSHLNILLNTLHHSKVQGETKISNILHSLAESMKKRGLIILISDLFDDQEDVIKGLRHFRYKGHEIIVFHIMDDKEISLDFNESVNFIDLENNDSMKTDPRQIKSAYQKAYSNFCNQYKNECSKNNIDYVPVNTSDSLDKSLIEYLIKRTKVV
ncbi:MAG: DUF58 domain-containing protein [Candidatus Marinimicrobia bacterium]|nr:DUF58 domain-containing protein [Candidatus Neomarinimicrobiota bacterium]|tara:strand:+ start:15867 stop:16763 length:897 start_codon:yes stop_codon:yes gene_type:complete